MLILFALALLILVFNSFSILNSISEINKTLKEKNHE